MSDSTTEQTLDQERRELWERVKARFNAWYHAHNFDMAEGFGPGWTPKYAEQMAWVLMTAPPEGIRLRQLFQSNTKFIATFWRDGWPTSFQRIHPDAACAVILAALAAAGEE